MRKELMVAFLALAACGGPTPPPALPTAQAPMPATGFDGTWTGLGSVSTTSRARAGFCTPEPIARRMTVNGNVARFEFGMSQALTFTGTVQPDGRLEMASGENRFSGQFSGDTFRGTQLGRGCDRTWEMRRSPA